MKKLIALTVMTLISGLAMANEPGKSETGLDYNKIDINYISGTVNSKIYTGYGVEGSFLVSDSIYVLGNYVDLTRTSATSLERSQIGLASIEELKQTDA